MVTIDKVFVGFAIVGGSLFFVRLVLFFLGGDADADADLDLDLDVGEAGDGFEDADVSFRVLSLQTVTAFFMMFGLVGLALRKEANLGEAWSILGGTAGGAVAVWVVVKVMSLMKRLQSSGTLNMSNAVGQGGSVYLTIRADGIGKVRVTVQGHLKVFNAITEGQEEIKTGERVTVVKVTDDNTLVVKKL